MGDLVIREAGAEDLLGVLGVSDQQVESATELEERTWERMMRSEDLTVYLAEVDGEPVGTATQMVMPHVTYDCAPTVHRGRRGHYRASAQGDRQRVAAPPA